MGFFEEQMPAVKIGDIDDVPVASRVLSGGRTIVARERKGRQAQQCGQQQGEQRHGGICGGEARPVKRKRASVRRAFAVAADAAGC